MISIPTARRQAREIGHSVQDEFYRLLSHGVLHLLGYDHERSRAEEKRMIAREDELTSFLWK
jgi:probable rRNA maturation factor